MNDLIVNVNLFNLPEIDYIYFFYGFSFILMGFVSVKISKLRRDALPWIYMILFGFLHGVNEWVDMIALFFGDSPAISFVKSFLLVSSFMSLFEFGRAGTIAVDKKGPSRLIYIPFLLFLIWGGWGSLKAIGISARYSFGLFGALWSAFTLFRFSKKQKNNSLIMAVIGFMIYGISTGIIVPKASFFPASVLNYHSFMNLFGFPVQLLRGIMAVIISISIWRYYVVQFGLSLGRYGRNIKPYNRIVYFLILILVAGWIAVISVEKRIRMVLSNEMDIEIQSAIASVNTRRIANLLDKPNADSKDADYHRLKEQMILLSKAQHEFRYIFLLGLKNNEVSLFLCSEEKCKTGFLKSGIKPDECCTEILEKLLKNKDLITRCQNGKFIITGPLQYKQDQFIFELAPLRDIKSGEIIAVMGISESLKHWTRKIIFFRFITIFITLLFCLGSIALSAYMFERTKVEDVTGRNKENMKKINDCLVGLGNDHKENINRLTALAGELLEADCALYNRLDHGNLCSVGQWHAPQNYNPVNKADGHVCSDVIKNASDESIFIQNLHETDYFCTDPNIKNYGICSYMGHVVKSKGNPIGSLCLLYTVKADLTHDDKMLSSIVASAIGNEESKIQAEILLEQVRRQNQNILESAGEGIIGLDSEGKHVFINPAACRMLGYQPDELIGKMSHTLWHHKKKDGSHYPTEECPVYSAYKDGKVHRSDQEVFWKKDGTSFSVEYTSTPVWEMNKLVGAVLVFNDITERKQTEEKIKNAAREWETTFDSMSDGVSIHGENFEILNVNEALCQILGKKKEEVIGKKCYSICHAKECPLEECVFQKSKESHEKEYTEIFEPILNKWIAISVSPLLDRSDRVEKVIHVIRDITLRKKSEEALQKAHDELEIKVKERTAELIQSEKLASLGQIAAGIAHELNTPLNVILGYLEIMNKKLRNQEPFGEYLQCSLEGVEQCRQLINDFMTYAKPQDTGEKLYRIFNLNEAIYDALRLVHIYQKSNIQVVQELDAALLNIKGNKKEMMQVFINLINNAIDAMPEGGTLTLSTGKIKETNIVEFRVTDTGIGISESNINKVFDPFFTTKRPGKGTGLGLSIISRIMENHKGRIRVKSREGKGTSFIGELPQV